MGGDGTERDQRWEGRVGGERVMRERERRAMAGRGREDGEGKMRSG